MKLDNTIRVVQVHTYVDQLIDNEDGKFDALGSAYLVVPRGWAEDLVLKQGFESMEEFLSEYTYDDTVGWIGKAIEDGVLLGTGTGL